MFWVKELVWQDEVVVHAHSAQTTMNRLVIHQQSHQVNARKIWRFPSAAVSSLSGQESEWCHMKSAILEVKLVPMGLFSDEAKY